MTAASKERSVSVKLGLAGTFPGSMSKVEASQDRLIKTAVIRVYVSPLVGTHQLPQRSFHK